jgi:hypothetical protein
MSPCCRAGQGRPRTHSARGGRWVGTGLKTTAGERVKATGGGKRKRQSGVPFVGWAKGMIASGGPPLSSLLALLLTLPAARVPRILCVFACWLLHAAVPLPARSLAFTPRRVCCRWNTACNAGGWYIPCYNGHMK